MFGRIVPFYDLLNRLLSLGLDQHWRKVLARNVRLGETGRVLDLAAGTLDVSLAIRRRYPSAIVPAMLARDLLCNTLIQRYRIKSREEWNATPGFEAQAAKVTGEINETVDTVALSAMKSGDSTIVDAPVEDLARAFKRTLDW